MDRKDVVRRFLLFNSFILCLSLSGCASDNSKETSASETTVQKVETEQKTETEQKIETGQKPETEKPETEKEAEEILPEFNTDTEFDWDLLRNWNDDAIYEEYGVESIREFTPENPQPMTYIVSAPEVIDPVTGQLSEGGYDSGSARHLPVDTEQLMKMSGKVVGGGLTMTDDPNQATYAVIIDFEYEDSTGSFNFSDGSTAPQYSSLTKAELLDLVTGESVSTDEKEEYATKVGESVRKDMLEAAKGKQLYAGSADIWDEDFPYYWEFVAGGERRASAIAAAEKGDCVMTLLPYGFDSISRADLADYLEGDNVTLQEDGCVTIIISEEELQERLAEVQKKVEDLAAELEEKTGIEKTSDDMTYQTFYIQGNADIETFADYAPRFQLYGKIYTALDDNWGNRVWITLKDRDTGSTLYEMDSILGVVTDE